MVPHFVRMRPVFALGLVVALAAGAAAGTVSNAIFRIEATNADGSGFLEFYANELVYNGSTNAWDWNKGVTEILNGSGDTIAVLDSATMSLMIDPTPDKPYRINLGFAVHAGSSLTGFAIRSAMITFSGTLDPNMLQSPAGGGRATASLGITDENGNGATLLAVGQTGIGAYRAHYNGWYPGGTVFSTLVNMVSAGPGGSGSGGQSYPSGSGYQSINVATSDMSAGLGFTLTAADSASGTTSYRILPEHAALGLAALGLLLGRRR